MENVKVFNKSNQSQYSDALECEAEGLEMLREMLMSAQVKDLRIPTVIEVSTHRLRMQRIHAAPADAEKMAILGRDLAKMHCIEHDSYGFKRNNYIGLNPQINRLDNDWGAFFVECRLKYQIGLVDEPAIKQNFLVQLNSMEGHLIEFLSEHCDGPSLLHGDLWSGNVMFDEQGAWLIDPAVYYGDSEADIAMTELFGGFQASFYESYQEVRPLSSVYPLKRTIYNLYHTFNHYNLFGNSYLPACQDALLKIKAELTS